MNLTCSPLKRLRDGGIRSVTPLVPLVHGSGLTQHGGDALSVDTAALDLNLFLNYPMSAQMNPSCGLHKGPRFCHTLVAHRIWQILLTCNEDVTILFNSKSEIIEKILCSRIL